MTQNEFYETLKEYAKKEMFEEGKKATESNGTDVIAHQAASNEAAKFYQLIECLWIDFFKDYSEHDQNGGSLNHNK